MEELIIRAIKASWSKETSASPDKWSKDNPSLGQCAVTALVIQDLKGGDLLRGKVNGSSHYWNRLPDGPELDLTIDQFGVPKPDIKGQERMSREYCLSFISTKTRYDILKESTMEYILD